MTIISIMCRSLPLQIKDVMIDMLTVSGDCVPFEEAETVLILKCWHFSRCKLRGELGRFVGSIVHISCRFVEREATNSCSGFDLGGASDTINHRRAHRISHSRRNRTYTETPLLFWISKI